MFNNFYVHIGNGIYKRCDNTATRPVRSFWLAPVHWCCSLLSSRLLGKSVASERMFVSLDKKTSVGSEWNVSDLRTRHISSSFSFLGPQGQNFASEEVCTHASRHEDVCGFGMERLRSDNRTFHLFSHFSTLGQHCRYFASEDVCLIEVDWQRHTTSSGPGTIQVILSIVSV